MMFLAFFLITKQNEPEVQCVWEKMINGIHLSGGGTFSGRPQVPIGDSSGSEESPPGKQALGVLPSSIRSTAMHAAGQAEESFSRVQ